MDTHYHQDTPKEVRDVLESAIGTQRRLRIFYGDQKTGRDWGKENDVVGTIGKSAGVKPIPLMLASRNSHCGPGILDNCIVKIAEAGRVLYQHPQYNQPRYTVGQSPARIGDTFMAAAGYVVGVYANGKNVANFKSLKAAQRWVAFMTGQRMAK